MLVRFRKLAPRLLALACIATSPTFSTARAPTHPVPAKIAEIATQIQNIEAAAPSYRRLEIPEPNVAPFNGEEPQYALTGYFAGKDLKKVVVRYEFGEHNNTMEFYYAHGKPIFVVVSDYHIHGIEGDTKIHIDLTERNRYYFQNGKVIRTTSEKPNTFPYDDKKFHPLTMDELNRYLNGIRQLMKDQRP